MIIVVVVIQQCVYFIYTLPSHEIIMTEHGTR